MITHLTSLIKQSKTPVPPEVHLIRGLSHEKHQDVSKRRYQWRLSKRDYQQMISFYEKALETESDHFRVPLSFALLSSLHNRQNHVIASTIRLDQFNALLDERVEFEVKWKEMLAEIEAMKKENISEVVIIQKLSQLYNIQANGERFDEEKLNEMLNLLLTDKLDNLFLYMANREQKKIDEEHLAKDGDNQNRLVFYRKLRTSFAHQFTAMAATSGNSDNEPIIRHDRQGIETK